MRLFDDWFLCCLVFEIENWKTENVFLVSLVVCKKFLCCFRKTNCSCWLFHCYLLFWSCLGIYISFLFLFLWCCRCWNRLEIAALWFAPSACSCLQFVNCANMICCNFYFLTFFASVWLSFSNGYSLAFNPIWAFLSFLKIIFLKFLFLLFSFLFPFSYFLWLLLLLLFCLAHSCRQTANKKKRKKGKWKRAFGTDTALVSQCIRKYYCSCITAWKYIR